MESHHRICYSYSPNRCRSLSRSSRTQVCGDQDEIHNPRDHSPWNIKSINVSAQNTHYSVARKRTSSYVKALLDEEFYKGLHECSAYPSSKIPCVDIGSNNCTPKCLSRDYTKMSQDCRPGFRALKERRCPDEYSYRQKSVHRERMHRKSRLFRTLQMAKCVLNELNHREDKAHQLGRKFSCMSVASSLQSKSVSQIPDACLSYSSQIPSCIPTFSPKIRNVNTDTSTARGCRYYNGRRCVYANGREDVNEETECESMYTANGVPATRNVWPSNNTPPVRYDLVQDSSIQPDSFPVTDSLMESNSTKLKDNDFTENDIDDALPSIPLQDNLNMEPPAKWVDSQKKGTTYESQMEENNGVHQQPENVKEQAITSSNAMNRSDDAEYSIADETTQDEKTTSQSISRSKRYNDELSEGTKAFSAFHEKEISKYDEDTAFSKNELNDAKTVKYGETDNSMPMVKEEIKQEEPGRRTDKDVSKKAVAEDNKKRKEEKSESSKKTKEHSKKDETEKSNDSKKKDKKSGEDKEKSSKDNKKQKEEKDESSKQSKSHSEKDDDKNKSSKKKDKKSDDNKEKSSKDNKKQKEEKDESSKKSKSHSQKDDDDKSKSSKKKDKKSAEDKDNSSVSDKIRSDLETKYTDAKSDPKSPNQEDPLVKAAQNRRSEPLSDKEERFTTMATDIPTTYYYDVNKLEEDDMKTYADDIPETTESEFKGGQQASKNRTSKSRQDTKTEKNLAKEGNTLGKSKSAAPSMGKDDKKKRKSGTEPPPLGIPFQKGVTFGNDQVYKDNNFDNDSSSFSFTEFHSILESGIDLDPIMPDKDSESTAEKEELRKKKVDQIAFRKPKREIKMLH